MKSNSNDVRLGFRFQHEQYLKRYDNAAADPDIQIFAAEEDDEEPEAKRYWCAICKSKLNYMRHTDTIWKCDNCQKFYDAKIQDIPIANNNKFRITPHHDINRYPKFDDDNPEVPFLKGIRLDEQQEDPSIEILKQSPDKRIQHICVKGSAAEALAAVNDLDSKR